MQEEEIPIPQSGGSVDKFPPFSDLLSNYPLPYEQRPDRTPANPSTPVDDSDGSTFRYFNQCAIRVSISLKLSGLNLNGVKNMTNPGGQTYADGNVLGATNLANHIKKYGKPEKFDGTKDDVINLLRNKTGIIYFEGYDEHFGTGLPENRRSSNAHIDLWNKDTIMAPYLDQMLNSKKYFFGV
ncbi:T6SS effector amidase Tae4 family protein [Chitinophagaceae bacterium LY-5]|uniref:T6SS effector amidase Tae4 family protein n=2 Tax=Polluticaenibacter yanchengensis TaxID=3014562 RepID=A0ABT4UPP8_9BACT|nr:T6SS effector amidase Tae4 family protein [Chitinophagaceae bacterium LY-5]